MTDKIKDFIEKYIKFIEENEWEKIYQAAPGDLKNDIGKFTEVMLAADIHPEYYLHELPKYFLLESNLKEFKITNNVTSIGSYAFMSCSKLTSVTIGNSVTSIGNWAFWCCSSLTSVAIPDSVTSIGKGAFADCSSLTNVTIPDSVTYIDSPAFQNCLSLINIIIKNPEIKFSDNVFEHCKDLDIQFVGTRNQWKTIAKGKFSGVTYTCTCIDGVVKKSR